MSKALKKVDFVELFTNPPAGVEPDAPTRSEVGLHVVHE